MLAVTATARSHRPAQMSLAGCLPSLASEASAKAAAVVVSAAISAAAVSAAAAKVATAARPTASGGQPLAAAVLLPGTAAGLLPAKLACAGTVILWRWPPPPPRGNSAGPRRGSFVAVNLRRGSQPGQPWPCRCADGAAVCVLQAGWGHGRPARGQQAAQPAQASWPLFAQQLSVLCPYLRNAQRWHYFFGSVQGSACYMKKNVSSRLKVRSQDPSQRVFAKPVHLSMWVYLSSLYSAWHMAVLHAEML